jgi:flagellar motor switch protein FliM
VTRMLTQDEIDALLQAAGDGTETTDAFRGDVHAVPYNFRRPDRVSKEQLRSLQFLHDRYAANVSTSLSVFLRTITEVRISSVDQFAYSEFLASLADPTAIYAVSLGRFDGLAALEISPPVAFTMVDRMLGGNGMTQAPNRALTEIEQNVLDSVVKLLLESLSETWRAIGEVEFRIHARDTRPQMVQITAANEIVILLSFDVKIGEAHGMLNLCIPATAIESMEDKVAQGWQRTRRQPSELEMTHLRANIGRVPLAVTAQLPTRLAARDLLDLQHGDVLSLGWPALKPVEIYVGRVPRFGGHLTATVNGAGVLIADTGQGPQRLAAAGEQP